MSPSPDPRTLWKAQPVMPVTLSAQSLAARARRLEARVRARNRIEYGAGGLLALFMLGLGIAGLMSGLETAYATVSTLGLFALAAGAITVCLQLHRRTGGPGLVSGVLPSRAAYRAELARQRDALRSVWLWYIAPLVPGVLLIYGADFFRPQPSLGITVPLLAATLGFFGLVIALNHRAAARIDAEITALDAENA